MSILYFLVFLGVLIFFHELGHFVVARLVGVTVLRFSIGFGPRIIGFRRGETEYWISAIPLGGYVKFLGDDPENLPAQFEEEKGFLTTKLWRRVLIVIAGPLFNILLPPIVFLPIFLSSTELPPAVLGTVARGGPAFEAGLRSGDRVVAIEGESVTHFWELQKAVSSNPGRPLSITVDRGGKLMNFVVRPANVFDPMLKEVGIHVEVGQIEVTLEASRPIVLVMPGSQAEASGIKDFDAVLEVDGFKPSSFEEVENALRSAGGSPVRMKVASTSPDSTALGPAREVVLASSTPGLLDGSNVVASVTPSSPADLAGLKVGDRIVKIDGRDFSGWLFMVQEFERSPDRPHVLKVISREGEEREVTVNLLNPLWSPGAAVPKYTFGAENRRATVLPEPVPNAARWRYAIDRTWNRTKKVFVVSLGGIYGLITGRVSVKEMGGPIMIYQIASTAGERGAADFFDALAWLSMSLGLLNLLPVPVLDGGHLLLFGIEAVMRRPLSRRGRQLATYAGLALLLSLMVLVFLNDIERTFGRLSGLPQ